MPFVQRSSARLRFLLPAVVAGALLAIPAAASASRAAIDGSTLRVFGETGEANVITVTPGPGPNFTVRDTGATMHPEAGCSPSNTPSAAECPSSAITRIEVDAGDLNDSVSIIGTSLPTVLSGGGGDDSLTGGDGPDTLRAQDGRDALNGGGSDDTLNGGLGPDTLAGGSGTSDTADYGEGEHDAGVRVTIGNAAAPDGLPGEGDDVQGDIEVILGSEGDDGLTGTEGNETFYGEGGNDFIIAGGGDDALFGQGGSEILVPGLGTDTVDGGDGGTDYASYPDRPGGVNLSIDDVANDGAPGENDNIRSSTECLYGSEGPDRLTGSDGFNCINGDAGDDVLDGRGGNDTLTGQRGQDVVIGGPGDFDSVSWPTLFQPGPFVVTLAGGADDGPAGDGDDVHPDVEAVFGSDQGDTLSGGDAANQLYGLEGNDRLFGGRGQDYLRGAEGDDRLNSADGVLDSDDCGPGIDTVYADRVDSIDPSCESVTYSLLTDAAARAGSFSPRLGLLPVRLACPDFSVLPCRYDIRLDLITPPRPRASATKRAARRTTQVDAGAKRTVKLRLSRRMRTLVRRRGTARFRLTVLARAGGTGPRSTMRRTVVLRARR